MFYKISYSCQWKIESTSKTVPFGLPELNVKAFDRVKRDKLFEILQRKNIPNLLLKHVIEIYSGNKSKYTQQINRRT